MAVCCDDAACGRELIVPLAGARLGLSVSEVVLPRANPTHLCVFNTTGKLVILYHDHKLRSSRSVSGKDWFSRGKLNDVVCGTGDCYCRGICRRLGAYNITLLCPLL